MRVVLNWVRANVYTVICAAVMIAAPAALWVFSGRMNSAVRQEVQKRTGKMGELQKFETTPISLESPVPGNEPVSAKIAVNRRFLERYQKVVGMLRADAQSIRDEVLAINRKGRSVLNDKLFPSPPMEQREILPKEMYRQLITAYTQLLGDVHAGSPPSAEQMTEYLGQAKERYLTEVRKRSSDALTPEEQEELSEQLTKARLSYCAEAARAISFYATPADIDIPSESQRPVTAQGQGMIDMFNWQWEFWIKEDVLRALYEANREYPSVVEAPVKRVISIGMLSAPAAAAAAAAGDDGSDSGPIGGFSAGGGRRGGGGGEPSGQMPAVAADPAQEVPPDYTISFTGRHTNPLFDVWYVRVDLIVDSARVPAVFDALALQNFMTVVNAQIESADPFGDLKAGYFYGAPVSRLTLDIETVWLREWTAPFMPVELKQVLGVPVPPAPAG